MSTIICDDSTWPLATVTFLGNADEDFERYLAFLHRCHLRRSPWCLMLDTAKQRAPVTAPQRKKMADFLRDHQELAREYCAGTAFVIDSPLYRGVLTAIFWFQRQPTPYAIVPTRDKALAWLSHRAQSRGVSLPVRAIEPELQPDG